MPARLPAKERVDENNHVNDVTKTVIVLPSVGEMVLQEGRTHRKRAFRRTVPAVSCSDCGLDFRSMGAFKRHQRDWHAVDGDGGDMTAVVGTSKTAVVAVVSKSCPYCTEQFPVSQSKVSERYGTQRSTSKDSCRFLPVNMVPWYQRYLWMLFPSVTAPRYRLSFPH
jgi:hypothetical protein